jgi:hypothetical protein
MIIYEVRYKDKESGLLKTIGYLPERRELDRIREDIFTGLRWALGVFGEVTKNYSSFYVKNLQSGDETYCGIKN